MVSLCFATRKPRAGIIAMGCFILPFGTVLVGCLGLHKSILIQSERRSIRKKITT